MLERLQFTNFKTWERVDMPLGRVTALFGTNSSGKTSILQFLLLLKQTKDATDRSIALELNGDLVQLGTITDAIHRHDNERAIRFRCDFARPGELRLLDPEGKRRTAMASSKRFAIESEVIVKQQAPSARLLRYFFEPLVFSLTTKNGDDTQFELKEEGLGAPLKRTSGRPWALPGPIKSYAFPDQARTYFQNTGFLSDLELAYEEAIDRIYYLGPLRQYPSRDYLWARSRPSDVGQRGEKAINAILAASEANWTRNLKHKAHRKSFQEIIAHWLKEMGPDRHLYRYGNRTRLQPLAGATAHTTEFGRGPADRRGLRGLAGATGHHAALLRARRFDRHPGATGNPPPSASPGQPRRSHLERGQTPQGASAPGEPFRASPVAPAAADRRGRRGGR